MKTETQVPECVLPTKNPVIPNFASHLLATESPPQVEKTTERTLIETIAKKLNVAIDKEKREDDGARPEPRDDVYILRDIENAITRLTREVDDNKETVGAIDTLVRRLYMFPYTPGAWGPRGRGF